MFNSAVILAVIQDSLVRNENLKAVMKERKFTGVLKKLVGQWYQI